MIPESKKAQTMVIYGLGLYLCFLHASCGSLLGKSAHFTPPPTRRAQVWCIRHS